MKNSILAGAAFATMASVANAQDQGFAAKMREVNANAPIPSIHVVESDALATLQAIAKQNAQCVPSGVIMETPTPATADRMAVLSVQAGKLKNLWLAYGMPIGCADVTKTRFMVMQMPDETFRARVVNEGESLAWPSLMRDTSANAAIVAWSTVKATDATCDGRDMDMIGTKIGSRGADLSPDFFGVRFAGSWEETWTFKVCRRLAEVPVSFKADGAGGAYTHVKQEAVKLSTP